LKASDELAKRVAASQWTDALSRKAMNALISARGDFRQLTAASQARREERFFGLGQIIGFSQKVRPGDS
jgi:hypothetical protein